ncbi:TIGR00266 family protein [Picosynechococcus sp. PCC 7003]|uniref:TIGR00266 family protein n=1 Tax=Picosynechococcus sp. PCC 7003 TaxID=374981 RepID=UPI000810C1A1|nr:TIGR00266 family protein [Picosynechococcus sp. PCC 7003]ANV84137.1 TIGR00266 family protein [Picosynechococcus sp. PCC 7003]
MKYEIRYKPAFACLFVTLEPGEQITAESGAMVSMDGGILMKTEFSGGFFPAILRRLFGGESLFVNVYRNTSQRPQTVILTQSIVGDIHRIDLSQGPICFQPGAYIAHTPGAKMGIRWAGFASWFAGEGLFKLQFTGSGRVFYGCYGGIIEKQIAGEFIVDNSHLVAYDPGITMNIRMSGGLFGSLTSGEGLVNKLKGRGRIYLQSRSVSGLVGFLRPKCR